MTFFKRIFPHLNIFVMWSSLFWIFLAALTSAKPELKRVSQCYNATGFPFISLYCGNNHVIQIHRALHGNHLNPRIKRCGRIQGDCVIDKSRDYDWSKCEGQMACVQHIAYKNMKNCKMETDDAGLVNTAQKFKRHARDSEITQEKTQYLEVEYFCVHTSSEEYIQKQQRNKVKKTAPKREINRDICTNYTEKARSIILQNPGYPHYYQTSTDCRCIVQAPESAKVSVTFRDLSLVMQDNLCVDWLLLKSPGHKDSTVVACGTLGDTTRIVESKSNWLLLHFHTSRSKSSENLHHSKKFSGFQIRIQSQPREKFNMKCYTVDPDAIDKLSNNEQAEDGLSNLVLPASDWDQVSKPGALQTSGQSTPMNFHFHFTLLTAALICFIMYESVS